MFPRKASHPSRPYRLLVETDDPALEISDFVCFAAAGFDVTVCNGPSESHRCAAVDGHACHLVEAADVVLNALRDPAIQATVVESVHATSPCAPMVVNVVPGMAEELPDGCVRLSSAVSIAGQTHALRRVATQRR